MSNQEIWPWPDRLDALIAAPTHHTLLFENHAVRVLDTRVPPGETVPLHTHRWPSVLHVPSWSDCVRRDGTGRVLMDSRLSATAPHEGSVSWTSPLEPHSLENVGRSELRVLSVELKNS